jgi:tetratricopeptide (TPR) repeat protein/transglutaminase-like putative cysteine protease
MRATSLGWVLLSGIGFTASFAHTNGQTTSKSGAAKGADPYAAEAIVVERRDSAYKMAADGTGTHELTIVARIQSEAALHEAGVLNVPYAANSEHVEYVYARVRHKDGTVTETPVSGAMEVLNPVTREAPFYSDLKEMQLPVKRLGVGDTLEWQARIVRTKAEAPGEFWGQESFLPGAVVLAETVELQVPKDRYVNVWSPGKKPVETMVGDERVYRWTNEQLKPTTGPEVDAEKEAKKKRVLTAEQERDEKEGKLPDVAWTTFKSWEDVGAWYRGLEGDRMVPDAEVKAKVAELTAGKTTEQEKVEAVYRYVSSNIRYIGVAFGVGRYQPHAADVVMENQYGDCKDKHTLLAAMLEALGEHPDAVLIGAGIRFNPAVPSPAAFNHLITNVTIEGKSVWLDTTAEVAPYGLLMYVIRDHDALVVPETGVARVERTPAKAPLASMQKLEANGSLSEDGISTSRFVLTFRGDEEVELRSALRQFTPAQYDQVVQRLVAALSFGGTVSHAEISSLEDTTEPLKISFDYKRERVGGDWDNYRTLAQFMPTSLPRPSLKDSPIQSINLGVPRVEVSSAAMKLPPGWGVVFPEAVHEKSAYATWDVTYRFDKGVMYSERRVEVLQEKVPVAEWKSYSKFAEKVEIGDEQYLQLVRNEVPKPKSNGKSEANAVSSGALSGDAATLVKDAYIAIARRDFKGAEPMLDSAKEINPKQARLWSTYGYLSFQRGEMETAIVDYKKELELHPDAYGVYASMADAQYRAGKKDEANETLKTWMSLEPQNPAAPTRLTTFLMAEDKPAAAAAAASSALGSMPEGSKDEGLRLLLGKAQLAAGMKDKAGVTLGDLLRATENTGIENDAAYELANAGLELPLAETSARHALESMEAETRGWTLDEDVRQLRVKTNLLDATWDTMGWILFREGKLDEAQSYVQASWRGRQSAEVGKHVGEIAAAKGNKSAALGAYELALATTNPYAVGAGSGTAAALTKDLNERIAALRKVGTADPITDEGDALQKMRMIPLGSAGGLNGVAEYKLLLNAGKIQRAEPMGAKSLPGGADRLKKAELPGFFPAGSKANLVLAGIMNCHSGVCELVLEP